MAYIEIAASKKPDNDYHVSVSIYLEKLASESHVLMTRNELKELRDMLHNALIELNQELNYED